MGECKQVSQKRDLFVTQFTLPETNMTIRICQEATPKGNECSTSNHPFFRCYVSFRGYLSSIFECTELLVGKNSEVMKVTHTRYVIALSVYSVHYEYEKVTFNETYVSQVLLI